MALLSVTPVFPPPMEFIPPPPWIKLFLHHGICVGGDLPYGITPPPPPPGKFCHSISSGGGGGGCHMVLFPPSAMRFSRGKVCHMVFLHGERLPYGILSDGQSAKGICSLIMQCVWGDDIHFCTIEGEALPYGIVPPPPGKVLAWNVFRGRFAICYSFRGNACHMV